MLKQTTFGPARMQDSQMGWTFVETKQQFSLHGNEFFKHEAHALLRLSVAGVCEF